MARPQLGALPPNPSADGSVSPGASADNAALATHVHPAAMEVSTESASPDVTGVTEIEFVYDLMDTSLPIEFPSYIDLDDIANPATPGAGVLRVYGRMIAGRSMLKWTPPSGLDTPIQPALFGNQVILFTPYSGTTVSPNGFGAIWAKGGGLGTVSTPTMSSSSPTFMNSMRRTRHANVVTTTNQAQGIIATAAASVQFWRGNAAGLGGWFFFARFGLGIWLSGCRIFAGLTAGTAEVVTSDTIANNSVGLSRLSTDTGNTLSFVTRDGSTTNTVSVPSATIATGAVFDVYIFAKPNDSTIYYRVDQLDNGSGGGQSTLIDTSTTTHLPVNTTFLGPQVEMSNGTANITANTVAIDINRIYVESDH